MKKLIIILFVLAASQAPAQCPDGYAPLIQYSTLEYKLPDGAIFGDDGQIYYRVEKAVPEIQGSNIAEPKAEVTADTPAVEPGTTAEVLRIVLIALGSMLGFVLNKLLPLLNSLLKAHMHFRGSAVVADALTQALAELGAEVQKAVADGVITPEEKLALKTAAKRIASARLKNLSGFYKKDLIGWLDEVLEVQLAKLLARI